MQKPDNRKLNHPHFKKMKISQTENAKDLKTPKQDPENQQPKNPSLKK